MDSRPQALLRARLSAARGLRKFEDIAGRIAEHGGRYVVQREDVVVGQERTRGTFVVDGEKTVASNNCLIVYTRQADGRWLMHRDIWNTISDAAGSGCY